MPARPSLIIAALTVMFSSCEDMGTQPGSSVQVDVHEAAARYQINTWVVADTINRSVIYFLALGHTDSSGRFAGLHDPEVNLMMRFTGSNPPVKRFSACQTWPITDKQTGLEGRLFAFTDPVVQNDHSVLDGADYVGFSVDMVRMYLHRAEAGWIVDSVQGRGSIN